MKCPFRRFVALFALMATAAFAADAAAKTVKLTVVSGAPTTVTFVKITRENWIPEIDRRLKASGQDYRIEWVEAHAQSLASVTEVFETVAEGIAHVGLVLKNFEESKLPLEQYATMAPFAQHTPEQMIVIDRNMRKRVPAMNEVYLKHNQVFLVSGPSPGMDLFATFPIRTVDDLKGRKIGASGSFGQWFRGTSGVVVTSAMIESYTSIKNGVYEGYPISIGLAYPFKTYQVAPYYTEINFGTQPTSGVTVHTGTWNGFPDFVKDIFREAAEMWPKWSIETDTARETMFRERMEKEGVKFYTMPLSERRRWTMMMPNIAQQWAASVEEKGFPARAVLTAFMDELRALKVEIPRQWDRE